MLVGDIRERCIRALDVRMAGISCFSDRNKSCRLHDDFSECSFSINTRSSAAGQRTYISESDSAANRRLVFIVAQRKYG